MIDHLKEANQALVRAGLRHADQVRREAELIVRMFKNMSVEEAEEKLRENLRGRIR